MDTEYLKRVGLYIVSAVVSLCIIAYFGYHIWSTFKPDVKTEPITQSTVTKTADADCYIFRSEVPVEANSAGTLIPTLKEGDRVRVRGDAAGVYSSPDKELVAKINEIDNQLKMLEECAADNTVSLKDASKLDDEMYEIMTQIHQALAGGKVDAANVLRGSLISVANKKDILMGGSSDISVKLSQLRQERQQLVSGLGARKETIYASQSGYYYSECDGYETAFDPAVFENTDYASLKSLVTETSPSNNGSGGKIVTASKWYAVMFVSRGVGSVMTEGEYRNVTFPYNDSLVLEMKLERLIRGEDGYACIYSSSLMPEDFEYTRIQPVEISMAEYTGFKIRMSDVRIIDGIQGVYVLDGSTVKFRKISVITDFEGYYILETDPEPLIPEEEEEEEEEEADEGEYRYLKLHDLLIIEGTGLYDGRVLGK